MKNSKSMNASAAISSQNKETPRNPNTSGAKISGGSKNVNTTGRNGGSGSLRNNPNKSGCNC